MHLRGSYLESNYGDFFLWFPLGSIGWASWDMVKPVPSWWNPVPRFPLEKWTHILVYSASSGAEQSTPFAVSIADVSSSISALTFVDKVWCFGLAEGKLGRGGLYR